MSGLLPAATAVARAAAAAAARETNPCCKKAGSAAYTLQNPPADTGGGDGSGVVVEQIQIFTIQQSKHGSQLASQPDSEQPQRTIRRVVQRFDVFTDEDDGCLPPA